VSLVERAGRFAWRQLDDYEYFEMGGSYLFECVEDSISESHVPARVELDIVELKGEIVKNP
jgi:hypothetical protein